jgi:GH24 family phage-related lysozyme (muramidase)
MSNVDYDFIREREGFKTIGYQPTDSSGVTIGMGVDLKSKNRNYFKGLPKKLVDKLAPYFGLTGSSAEQVASNLVLEEDEAQQVSEYVKDKELNTLKTKFKKESGVNFDNLPTEIATPIASVAFQYGMGNPKERFPNFWKAATAIDTEAMEQELRNFGDDYGSRRKLEADYLTQPLIGGESVDLISPPRRPQLASDIVEAAAVPAESGGISDLVSQVGSSLGFDRGSPRSTLAPSGLSEQEDARFNLLLQNLTGK